MERKRERRPRGRGERQGRRTPPPAATGGERVYLNKQVADGHRVTLSLADGQEFSGTLIEHDRDMITIESDSGPRVIRKSEIRYISE